MEVTVGDSFQLAVGWLSQLQGYSGSDEFQRSSGQQVVEGEGHHRNAIWYRVGSDGSDDQDVGMFAVTRNTPEAGGCRPIQADARFDRMLNRWIGTEIEARNKHVARAPPV
jgi:hypothetical protein